MKELNSCRLPFGGTNFLVGFIVVTSGVLSDETGRVEILGTAPSK